MVGASTIKGLLSSKQNIWQKSKHNATFAKLTEIVKVIRL